MKSKGDDDKNCNKPTTWEVAFRIKEKKQASSKAGQLIFDQALLSKWIFDHILYNGCLILWKVSTYQGQLNNFSGC